MSYPARGPARSVGIDGQANGPRGRRISLRKAQTVVEAAT